MIDLDRFGKLSCLSCMTVSVLVLTCPPLA